jgi:hypothetical protein
VSYETIIADDLDGDLDGDLDDLDDLDGDDCRHTCVAPRFSSEGILLPTRIKRGMQEPEESRNNCSQ